jgi:hypothetical protein
MSTLANIRTKVRRLTGRPSAQQITDTQIDEYVNTFYQYDFPEHLRVFSNETTFTLMTIANVDQYKMLAANPASPAFNELVVTYSGGTVSAANAYYNIKPPVYIEGYQSWYSQNREQFFRTYPMLGDELATTITGDGSTGPYTFTCDSVPVFQNEVYIGAVDSTGATVKVQDVPSSATTGTWQEILTGTTVTGSINYLTGAGTITFANAIPSGNEITVIFTPYQPNRPQAVLFYDNVITLRPVPDKPYPVQMNAFLLPTALAASSDEPLLNQWWQYLAYGAAKKIFEDSQDPEGVTQIMPAFKEQEELVLHRHIVQQTNERTATIYTEMTSFPYSNFNNRF